MKPKTVTDAEQIGKNKPTSRERFLIEMDQVLPWVSLIALINPYYPKKERCLPAYSLMAMLRVHLMQNWFGHSDQAIEESLYETPILRRFAGLGMACIPDEATILNFRLLLEKEELAGEIFDLINGYLADRGLLLRNGTIVDATIFHLPNSISNIENNSEDPKIKNEFMLADDRTHIQSLSTDLCDLEMPDRFLKLVKRLRNTSLSHKTFILGETLGDLVGLYTSDIASLPGVGESYVETFKELKRLAKETNINNEFAFNLDQINVQSLCTNIHDLKLPDRFLKLIKRLHNTSLSHAPFILGETFGDLVSLEASDIATLPGVGASYVETFKELKLLSKVVPMADIGSDTTSDCNSDVDFNLADISNMRLSQAGVGSKFTKALEKYARHIGTEDLAEHLDEILKLNKGDLVSLPGFGLKVADSLVEFRNVVRKEMELILTGSISYRDLESSLIVPRFFEHLQLSKIEEVLLEDINTYFDKIDESEVYIAKKRWGFLEKKQTLEEISTNFNITRERIRQKEVKINKRLLQHQRISQAALWQLLEPELSPCIKIKLNKLYSCFSSEKVFYEFLGLVCGQDNLYTYAYPELDDTIFNIYFAENGTPINIIDAREYIAELNISEIKNIDNAIKYLSQQGFIDFDGEYIWPRLLGKSEASACVLFNHEHGLPWLDVAKLVNTNKYSRTNIYEDRFDAEAFKCPDFIFLSSQGTYRHTRFITDESMFLDDIFTEIIEYTESGKRCSFHLMECYQASKKLQNHDYFVIRHFVKRFGEDYGFYFDGRSQTDSVGLEKKFKLVTQKDVIIKVMNRSEGPLTTLYIATLLKSKSRNHASFYINTLINEGKVVRVDRTLYTTPDLAYKNIKIYDYVDEIGKILQKCQKPVDPSALKESLNEKFSQTHSKYFYASIARLYAKRKGWSRNNNLYSAHEIPFKNITAAIESVCSLDSSVSDNVVALQNLIEIEHETAAAALSNWKCVQ